MRKITREVVGAFVNKRSACIDNTNSDGQSLRLHGNKIAEYRQDGMYITTCGWETKTTLERLNGIPNVDVCIHKGHLFLNGTLWDGDWVKVAE